MNLLFVSGIVLLLFTFLTLAARGGSSVESTVNPGPTSSAGVPDSAQAPLQDYLVTTSHSAMIHGQLVDYTAVAGTMVVDTEGGKCIYCR